MHCGDQRHLGSCLGYVPALAYGSYRVSDQGTTPVPLISTTHNLHITFINSTIFQPLVYANNKEIIKCYWPLCERISLVTEGFYSIRFYSILQRASDQWFWRLPMSWWIVSGNTGPVIDFVDFYFAKLHEESQRLTPLNTLYIINMLCGNTCKGNRKIQGA